MALDDVPIPIRRSWKSSIIPRLRLQSQANAQITALSAWTSQCFGLRINSCLRRPKPRRAHTRGGRASELL